MNVLVLSHSEIVRAGLSVLLDRISCVASHSEWPTSDSATAMARLLEDLDVMIADAGIPADELEPIFAEADRRVVVLLLVTDVTPHGLNSALRVPADGYLLFSDVTTDALRDTLMRAIQRTLPLPSQLASRMLERLRHPSQAPTVANLTPRETEVVALLSEGLSNQQIASRLRISLHGVKRHVSSILGKFGCPNRAQVVSMAFRSGLCSDSTPPPRVQPTRAFGSSSERMESFAARAP